MDASTVNDDVQSGYVSGRFLEDLLRLLSQRRVDVSALLSGMGIDREQLRRGHPLVEWDVFVEILSRLESEVGGPRRLQEMGEGIADTRAAPILRRLAGLSANPVLLYRVADRWALRRAIPLLRNRIERLDPSRLRVTSAIPEPHRPCPQLFHLAAGVLRAAPRILDLPDAVVNADVQPARGEFIVFLPSSGTLGARIRRAVRVLFSARAAFDQLEVQQGEVQRHFLEMRAAYAVLEESEARHRALTETAVDIVVEIEPDETLTYLSPSTEELTGHRCDQLIGMPFSMWVHPDEVQAARDEFEGVVRTGIGGRPIVRIGHKDGGWISMEVEARTYRTRDGDLRMVAILRDVSERLRIEEERRRSHEQLEAEVTTRTRQLERRNRELRELQSLLLQAERLGTAHDLSAQIARSIDVPLGALIGRLQAVLREPDSERRDIERTLELAVRVREVVTRIQDLYREGKVNRAPTQPGALMHDVAREIEGLAALHDVRVSLHVAGSLPVLDADATLLGSAITAIAENAIESIGPGGRVELSATLDEAGEDVEFGILDDGAGIPPELRDQVFDPFFTTKRTGSGLGLAIARGIVLGHGGRIDLTSRPELDGT